MIILSAIFFYVLSGQTYLSNEYLMPCLESLSTKWHLSETGTGILMALGMSIPELTTNILSCFKSSRIGYGFGAIVGSGVFDFTVCFGLMSLFSNYYHKRALRMNLKALMRDIYVYLLTLLFLTFVFWDYEISLTEALILTLFYPSYLLYSLVQMEQKDDFQLSHQKHHFPTLLQFLDFHPEQAEDLDVDGKEIGQENQQDTEQQQQDQQPSKILLPFTILFKLTIPKHPEFAFIIISFYCFLTVNVTMTVVDEFVEQFAVSPAFVGLTIASWGGNIQDVLNASLAAKNKKTELATSSIIGSQIMNLQICLGFPWVLTMLIWQRNITFYDETISQSMLAIMTVVLTSFFLMLQQKLRLTYKLGIMLLSIYLLYFIYELLQQ
ncbi:unnamed protein product [Paramecium primaurelia]|uniref:Sodium/calcium exchanger membrane region domain-containing protein n=1 Tax=Paramecium primaurelia TaxID=5886 RepID=A0A8S1PIG6_PARPR|nr:unnamed protein product [Paramecium primaurelia]